MVNFEILSIPYQQMMFKQSLILPPCCQSISNWHYSNDMLIAKIFTKNTKYFQYSTLDCSKMKATGNNKVQGASTPHSTWKTFKKTLTFFGTVHPLVWYSQVVEGLNLDRLILEMGVWVPVNVAQHINEMFYLNIK